jgi:hypothetical protein
MGRFMFHSIEPCITVFCVGGTNRFSVTVALMVCLRGSASVQFPCGQSFLPGDLFGEPVFAGYDQTAVHVMKYHCSTSLFFSGV